MSEVVGNRDSEFFQPMERDPTASLSELEQLGLAIRFGTTHICAALTHGHSFETSIFRLPAKCSACSEVVWGPFKRGCTCLSCGLSVHRTCASRPSMPPCPVKGKFMDFCRAELRLAEDKPPPSFSDIKKRDSEGWSTVERGGRGEKEDGPPTSPKRGETHVRGRLLHHPSFLRVRDLGASFTWVPFSNDRRGSPKVSTPSPTASSDGIGLPKPGTGRLSSTVAAVASSTPSLVANGKVRGTSGKSGLGKIGKMSVAGGFMGAVIGGPGGAMVGMKLGAVFAAGKMSAETLWQRIEKERKEASAQEIDTIVKVEEGGAGGTGHAGRLDIWAQIAAEVQGETGITW
ncbi:unnamed protein product [Discosporangium mesarthrocarpum]